MNDLFGCGINLCFISSHNVSSLIFTLFFVFSIMLFHLIYIISYINTFYYVFIYCSTSPHIVFYFLLGLYHQSFHFLRFYLFLGYRFLFSALCLKNGMLSYSYSLL